MPQSHFLGLSIGSYCSQSYDSSLLLANLSPVGGGLTEKKPFSLLYAKQNRESIDLLEIDSE